MSAGGEWGTAPACPALLITCCAQSGSKHEEGRSLGGVTDGDVSGCDFEMDGLLGFICGIRPATQQPPATFFINFSGPAHSLYSSSRLAARIAPSHRIALRVTLIQTRICSTIPTALCSVNNGFLVEHGHAATLVMLPNPNTCRITTSHSAPTSTASSAVNHIADNTAAPASHTKQPSSPNTQPRPPRQPRL